MHDIFKSTDNELTIEVEKIKNKDLKLTISHGSITMNDDGKIIARVTNPGRARVEVYNKKD